MEFWANFLGAILGTGVGGTILYLASQKFIENQTKPKFEEIEQKIQNIENSKVSVKDFEKFEKIENQKFIEFKNDYVPVKVYETSQKYLNESLKEIKEMIRYLTEKVDKEKQK